MSVQKYSNTKGLVRLRELTEKLDGDQNVDYCGRISDILKKAAGLVLEIGTDNKISFCSVGHNGNGFIDGKAAIGNTVAQAFSNGLTKAVVDSYTKCLDTMRPVRTKILHGADTDRRSIQIRAVPSEDNVILMVRDITEECE